MSTISEKMHEINALAKVDPMSLPVSEDWKRGAAWAIGQLREIMDGMPNRYCSHNNPMTEFSEVYLELGEALTSVNPARFEQLCLLYKEADLKVRNRILAAAHMIICCEDKGGVRINGQAPAHCRADRDSLPPRD